uniref:Transmembrane protein 268 n=1 Tax=Serinus canaria TaxID=9135 RepID=A0A8C9MWI3_SERCA
MAQKSQTGGTEKNGSSLLYSKSDFEEGALQWVPEPPQGRVLLVLSMDNTCPSSSFDMELCADKLQSLGVQVPMDLWRRLIQEGVLSPQVRRYLFYSSRGFQIAMAMVFYISFWTNLYSTLQLCSLGHSWGAGVLVTLVALALTVLVILVIDGHQRKAMAQQLLVIFSACYVRLLVTGRLPPASPGGHLGHSSVPCLCQFIQSTLLCC